MVVVAGAMLAAPGAGGSRAAAAAAVPAKSGGSHPGRLDVKSKEALVVDEEHGQTLFEKNPEHVAPIASITKLMTAMVVLDAQLPLDEIIAIERADVDSLKHTHSRLGVGTKLRRGDLLWVALMSSENRAAAALARTYPGGLEACVAAMNRKAQDLGMTQARFADPTGLSSDNVSSAGDLATMVRAASRYSEIREATTSSAHTVTLPNRRVIEFHNSNGLVSNRTWSIGLSKTGYINEAGRCLVMLAEIAARPVIIVLLDSWGKNTRLGDANRIRKWMETTLAAPGTAHAPSHGSEPVDAAQRAKISG
jgi:D-alanyl-D-alanine endopeptidase (penicillin-binding protein 7)